MINNKQEFFKLLKYSNELRKNNNSLFKENPEKSRKLSRFWKKIRWIIKSFTNLLIENKNYQIGMSLMSMYDHCDDFNPNSNSSITDEANLRNYAKMLLSELKRA